MTWLYDNGRIFFKASKMCREKLERLLLEYNLVTIGNYLPGQDTHVLK